MKKRIIIWCVSLCLAAGIFQQWYTNIPPLLVRDTKQDNTHEATKVASINNIETYKDRSVLIYGIGSKTNVQSNIVQIFDGDWLIRSTDPSGEIIFFGPQINGRIKGKGTIFISIERGILLSIDASLFSKDSQEILPSFYLEKGQKEFYDLENIQKLVGEKLWGFYKKNILQDEAIVYKNLSEAEIIESLSTLLKREPEKTSGKNIYFQKDTRIRKILEDILGNMREVRKEGKCGDNPSSCYKYISTKIQEAKGIDPEILLGLEDPLKIWSKKNSTQESEFSWKSIFQKYHFDSISDNKLAINTRDKAILSMIQSSKEPTYEMWQYLTFILSKQKQGSPYSIKIMAEMIRLGEILKDVGHKDDILKESNNTLSNLKTILEQTYFDKKEGYLYVLKEGLKDEKGQDIDTSVFVDDLNKLIGEIDHSTLFLEYPNFRYLRRHLVWFTCIFEKNQAYVGDIRICRSEI